MRLRELFEQPVDRAIEGVIKADDDASLGLEVKEYVLTSEVSVRLSRFLDAYNDYQGANGVWISGFFGSGKSHLLKMLALLLENREVGGEPVLDAFVAKCRDDAMLQGQMRKAASVPSHSILFNIDQKAVVISKKQDDAVLGVFVKVFNEMCGYYGNQGFIAQFERALDQRGLYAPFKARYAAVAGKPWETGREEYILESGNIDRAYAEVAGAGAGSVVRILDKYRQDYAVSIGSFADQVRTYLDTQPTGFRLNFFVDEVGQYIAGNVKLMTNLQTIAESLATKCRGRAWIIVTAQEDMDTVLGETGKQKGNDFSKIQDRFQTRLKLTSANVDEVIQKRLLWKTPQGARLLAQRYAAERNNFGTLFDFTDGSFHYRSFLDEGHFVRSMPFIPYQFTLFQSAIETLSAHSAFEGQNSSVGERSMLGVFQTVVVDIADEDVGRLATFDAMFEGIRATLLSGIQRSILNAEQHLGDPFAVRILKALFLVKYVKEFHATPRNLRVLMLERFGQDPLALQARIDDALALLEQQTYIQRNGDRVEFLSDEEKDIEQEIKNTDIDTGEVLRTLDAMLFADILRERKIRYDGTGQDFAFSRKIDEQVFGRPNPLTIHIVTPFSGGGDDVAQIQAHALGRPELTLVLPADPRLVLDLNLYMQTEKYIKQNGATAQQETVRRILSDRSFQNRDRLGLVRERLATAISGARLFVAGDEIEGASADPKSRIIAGFVMLIEKTYTNLRMLRGITYREAGIDAIIIPPQGMLIVDAETLSEAEQEMMAYIRAGKVTNVRTTMKSLVEHFSSHSYGWYQAAIQCILAKLCARGRIEVRSDSNLLEERSLIQALKNTRAFGNLILEPQIAPDPKQILSLKTFFGDFFDRPAGMAEAKALGQETGQAFRVLLAEINGWIGQTRRYPFLTALDAPQALITEMAQQSYIFYLTDLRRREDELFDAKAMTLDPVRGFMAGAGCEIYDDAQAFAIKQAPNFSALDPALPAQLRARLGDPACYKNNSMRELKRLVDGMQAEIDAKLADEKARVRDAMLDLEGRMVALPDFTQLPAEKQRDLQRLFEQHRAQVSPLTVIASVRDALNRFETQEYSWLLSQMTSWARPDTGGPECDEPQVTYISRHSIDVPFASLYLETEGDIDAYLSAVKEAMLAQIRQRKRIRV